QSYYTLPTRRLRRKRHDKSSKPSPLLRLSFLYRHSGPNTRSSTSTRQPGTRICCLIRDSVTYYSTDRWDAARPAARKIDPQTSQFGNVMYLPTGLLLPAGLAASQRSV